MTTPQLTPPCFRIGIMCHDTLGGSARMGVALAAQLALRGHQVHLFTLSPPQWAPDEEIPLTCHHLFAWDELPRHHAELYLTWDKTHRRAYTDMVVRVAVCEHLQLLHYHYAVPFAEIAAAIKQRLSDSEFRIAGTLHGTDVTRAAQTPGGIAGLQASLQHADLLTTVSNKHADLAGETFALDAPLHVVRNFIDLSHIQACSRMPDKHSSRRIVHISNFRPVKNPLLSVRLFAKIQAQLSAELWLVGDGPLLPVVINEVNALGLHKSVRYCGTMLEVQSILAEADLLLVSSHYESFCLVALEAMAMGVPVLAPAVGGIPELIDDGRTGLLYDPDSPNGGAQKALDLLADPAACQRLGKAAWQAARQYDSVRIVPEYENIYTDMLAGQLF